MSEGCRGFALVTGAGKRIGRAICEYLASEGWSLFIHYNNSFREAEMLRADLAERFDSLAFETIHYDLNEWEGVSCIFETIREKGVRVSLLVNNASVFDVGSIGEITPGVFSKQFNINLFSPFFLSKYFAQSSPSGGVVINILDTNVVSNQYSHSAYLLSKKGLSDLTQMAALEYAPEIRVNGIAPGPVLPPPGESDSYLQSVVENTPLQRQVDLKAITESLGFLINNQFVTGQIVFCDSGKHIGEC